MLKAHRQKAMIQSGGVISISSPELPAGTIAEVIVIVDASIEEPKKSLTSFIGAGKGSLATPEEADDFIRQLRG